MTKSRAVATRARLEIANRLTATGLSRDESELELNPGYLDDPEIVIIIRMDQPGFEELRVSTGDLVIGDHRVMPGDGSPVRACLHRAFGGWLQVAAGVSVVRGRGR